MNDTVVVKSDLVNEITKKVGLNQREAKEFVDAFFEKVRSTLEKHEEVKISGFGCFSVRHKPSRPGRNPKTGVNVTIDARSVVVFRASNILRKRVSGYKEPTPAED